MVNRGRKGVGCADLRAWGCLLFLHPLPPPPTLSAGIIQAQYLLGKSISMKTAKSPMSLSHVTAHEVRAESHSGLRLERRGNGQGRGRGMRRCGSEEKPA